MDFFVIFSNYNGYNNLSGVIKKPKSCSYD